MINRRLPHIEHRPQLHIPAGHDPNGCCRTRYAAELFGGSGVKTVLGLGAGHGRDTLFFARRGFTVHATDFSPIGLAQLRASDAAQGLAGRVRTGGHDVRFPLPRPEASVDAVFAHMLLCMALTTPQLHALVE